MAIATCININHPLVQEFSKELNIPPIVVCSDINLWQIDNVTNRMPDLSEFRRFQTEMNTNTTQYNADEYTKNAVISHFGLQQAYRGEHSVPNGYITLKNKAGKKLSQSINQWIADSNLSDRISVNFKDDEEGGYLQINQINNLNSKSPEYIYRRNKANNRSNIGQDLREPIDYVSEEGDMKIQYQKDTGIVRPDLIEGEQSIRDLAERMAERRGGIVKFISDLTKDYAGYREGNTSVINLAKATLDTPIHEILAHPIIDVIKNNPAQKHIYEDFLKELETGHGKEVLDGVKKEYVYKDKTDKTINSTEVSKYNTYLKNIRDFKNNPNFNAEEPLYLFWLEEVERFENGDKYTLEEQQEEALVQLLGELTAGKIKETKENKNLISLLKQLLKQMTEYMRSLFNSKEIEIDKLRADMTLNDLANLLAYTNSKIILPGNSVEYTTPDNQKFATYQEASNHISKLFSESKDVDLSSINIQRKYPIVKNTSEIPVKTFTVADEDFFSSTKYYLDKYNVWRKREGNKSEFDDSQDEIASEKEVIRVFNTYSNPSENYIEKFIERNKQFEQSKEIIETWKKENNIVYNPKEVYSRGQRFYSSLGAYNQLELDLLLQNILHHIEDNQKAGGVYALSAFTDMADINSPKSNIGKKNLGSKLRIVIYPKSEDILWAAKEDVNSGSVWETHKNFKTSDKLDKKELMGVSETKYPSLDNINEVQPNLASVIDKISWSHNELGIALNDNNWRIEMEDDSKYDIGDERKIPYKIKKLVNSVNSILDERYGKIVKPESRENKSPYKIGDYFNKNQKDFIPTEYDTKVETQEQADYLNSQEYLNPVIQPTQTKENTTSIESVKTKLDDGTFGIKSLTARLKYEQNKIKILQANIDTNNKVEESKKQIEEVKKEILRLEELIKNPPQKEYTEQALINTKITKLKEVAKKYPRSLISSKVISFNDNTERQYQKVNSTQLRIDEFGNSNTNIIDDTDLTNIYAHDQSKINNNKSEKIFPKLQPLERGDNRGRTNETNNEDVQDRLEELPINESNKTFENELAESASILGFNVPNTEEVDPNSFFGIWNRRKELGESIYRKLGESIKDRLFRGGGFVGRLSEALKRKGVDLSVIVFDSNPDLPVIFAEGKRIGININSDFINSLEKIKDSGQIVKYIEYILSEELLHLIQHKIFNKNEVEEAYNELSQEQIENITAYYLRNNNLSREAKLPKDVLVLEFLRMKTQGILFGETTEQQTPEFINQPLLRKLLTKLYNYIAGLFDKMPKDSITTGLLNKMINFINNSDNTDSEGLSTISAHFTNSSANKIKSEYDPIINQRRATLEYQRRAYRNEKDSDKKLIIKNRITKLTEDIKILEDTDNRSFDWLVNSAGLDVEAIENNLNAGMKDPNTLMYYLSLLYNYPEFLDSNFKSVIENLPKDKLITYDYLTNTIKRLNEKIYGRIYQNANNLAKQYGGASFMNIDGTLIDVSDISGLSENLLPAADQQHPLVKGINKIIQNTLDTINTRWKIFEKNHKSITEALIKYQKSLRLSKDNFYSFMLQTDNKGKKTNFVVGKYNAEYFDKRSNNKTNKYDRLRFFADAHKSFKVNEDAWDQRKERERKDFFNEPDRDEDNQNDVLAFNTYIDKMDPHSMMRVLESAKSGKISSVNANYLSFYSRNGYFSPELVNGQLVYPLEMDAEDKYLDSKYKVIMKMAPTDPRRKFYEYYVEQNNEARKRMSSVDFYTSWNEVPEMAKTSDVSSRMKEWQKGLYSENVSLNTRIKNPATGEYSLGIPTFINNKKGLLEEERSWDLGTILGKLVSESYRFNEVNEVKDDVDLMLEALRKVKTFRTNAFGRPVLDSNKEKIYKDDVSNLYKLIRYAVDSKLYGEDRVPEYATKISVESQSIKDKMKKLESQMKALELSDVELDEAQRLVNTNTGYAGNNSKISKFVELGSEYKNLSTGTRVVTGSAIGNSLIKLTQLRYLGLNAFAQFGELLQGIYSLSLASAGAKWFDSNQCINALMRVVKSSNIWMKGEASKIRKLSDFFDSSKESVFGVETGGSKIGQVAFLGYKGASYMINNTYLVAYMMNQKVQDRAGIEHRLYDVFDINDQGLPYLKGDFDPNYLVDVDNKPTDALTKIQQDYRSIIREYRDRKNQYDPIKLNQTFLGRAAGQFKASWMISAFMLRLGDETMDFNGNVVAKGFYRTLFDLFKLPETTDILGETIKDRSPNGVYIAFKNAFAEIFKYGWIGKMTGKKGTSILSDIDQRNMRMFVRELTWTVFIAGFIIVLNGLAKSGGDDDDKDKYMYFVNQATRLLRDLTTFSDPNSLISFTNNPLPIASTVGDTFSFLKELSMSGLAATPGYTLEDFHPAKKFFDLLPVGRQIPLTIHKFDRTVKYTN